MKVISNYSNYLPSSPSGVLHGWPGAETCLPCWCAECKKVTSNMAGHCLDMVTLLLGQSQSHHPHEPPVDTEVLTHAHLDMVSVSS